MLLTIHNLPPQISYSDVKNLLQAKCGLSDVILDNMLPEGKTKRVTVGLSNEGDAAILVRKINGLYLEGRALYVEDLRKKRDPNFAAYQNQSYIPGMPASPEIPAVQEQVNTNSSIQGWSGHQHQPVSWDNAPAQTNHSRDRWRNDRPRSRASCRGGVQGQPRSHDQAKPEWNNYADKNNRNSKPSVQRPPLLEKTVSRPERLSRPEPCDSDCSGSGTRIQPPNSLFHEQRPPRNKKPRNKKNQFPKGQQCKSREEYQGNFGSAGSSDGRRDCDWEPPVKKKKKTRPSEPSHSDEPIPKGQTWQQPSSLEKMMNRHETRKGQAASVICKHIIRNVQAKREYIPYLREVKALKQAIRVRLDVILGNKIGVDIKEMVMKYRNNYGRSTDIKLFNLVLARVKKVPEAAKERMQFQKKELAGEIEYLMEPSLQTALDTELSAIDDVAQAECKDPQDSADKVVCKQVNNRAVDELKKKIYRVTELVKAFCEKQKFASQPLPENVRPNSGNPVDTGTADIDENKMQTNEATTSKNKESVTLINHETSSEKSKNESVIPKTKLLEIILKLVKLYISTKNKLENENVQHESVDPSGVVTYFSEIGRNKQSGTRKDNIQITPSEETELLLRRIGAMAKILKELFIKTKDKYEDDIHSVEKNSVLQNEDIEQLLKTERVNEDIKYIPTSELQNENMELIPISELQNEDIEQIPISELQNNSIEQIPTSDSQTEDIESELQNEDVELIPTPELQNEDVEMMPTSELQNENIEQTSTSVQKKCMGLRMMVASTISYQILQAVKTVLKIKIIRKCRHKMVQHELRLAVLARLHGILKNKKVVSCDDVKKMYLKKYPLDQERELFILAITRLYKQQYDLDSNIETKTEMPSEPVAIVFEQANYSNIAAAASESWNKNTKASSVGAIGKNCVNENSNVTHITANRNYNKRLQNCSLEVTLNNKKAEGNLEISNKKKNEEHTETNVQDINIKTEVKTEGNKRAETKPVRVTNASGQTISIPPPLTKLNKKKTSRGNNKNSNYFPQCNRLGKKTGRPKRSRTGRVVKQSNVISLYQAYKRQADDYYIRQMKQRIHAATNLQAQIQTMTKQIAGGLTVKKESGVIVKQEVGGFPVNHELEKDKTFKKDLFKKVRIKSELISVEDC